MELEQQFLRLLDIVERIQNKVCQLEEENKLLIRGQKQMLEWVEMNQQDNVYFRRIYPMNCARCCSSRRKIRIFRGFCLERPP